MTLRQLVRVEGLCRRASVCAIVVAGLGQTVCSADENPQVANESTPAASERTPDSLLLVGGSITEQSDEAALRRIFGDTNVKEDRIQIGEGETLPGIVLFPNDSSRLLMIVWGDTVGRRLPSRLIIRGDSSLWYLRPGISLGTTLERLERLNGRPFRLAGFGWDYSGIVTDWRGGSLAASMSNARVYLSPPPSKFSSPVYSRVLGDKVYGSDLPAMKELRPVVYQIFYDFPEAGRN